MNVKAHQCETEKNPSYSTGNIARNKYNQAMTSRIGNQIDLAKRKGEIQKTKKDPNETASQSGYVKHPPKFMTEENITEMNPSYSTVPLPGVGEYSIIGPLYEKSDRKSHLSASLKATTDNRKGIRDSPKTSSFISSSRYVYRQQRESQDDKSAQAQPANLESNPAYSVLPGSDGEYSLVGPAYHKVSKAAASDVKAKHEYAEIKEANIDLESRESLQEKHSSRYLMMQYHIIS